MGGLGSFNGKFSDPNDVAVDSKGNIFVTDGYNNRIQKFQLSTVCAVNTIQFTSRVCLVKTWGTYGNADGEFEYPRGIVIDSTGNVFVVDAWNMWIQKFDNNGNFYYKMALINPSINLYNEYQMLSIYAVPNSITTAEIIAITEKFSSCYKSKISQASKNILK